MNAHRTCCKSGSRHMLSLLGDKAQSQQYLNYSNPVQDCTGYSAVRTICTQRPCKGLQLAR